MLEKILTEIILEKKQQGINKSVILNFIREYIQYLVLQSFYNHKAYKGFIFNGGSCLRICYGLPRLSEDLDFDYNCGKGNFRNFSIRDVEKYLKKEIKSKYFSNLETKLQGEKRIYLKFPFLYRLKLAEKPESDKLYVKIEFGRKVMPFAGFDLSPISMFGFNFIVYSYNLPSLMAGKINAILKRIWFKGKKQEIDIKGRDFYDLYWFLSKGVKPNMKILKKTIGINDENELKNILKKRIKEVITPQKLNYDLMNFIPDREFVKSFSKNYLKIIKKYL